MRWYVFTLAGAMLMPASGAVPPTTSASLDQLPHSWQAFLAPGEWSVVDGVLRSTGRDSGWLIDLPPCETVMIEVEVRAKAGTRPNFGLIARASGPKDGLVLRFYDRSSGLEFLRYTDGSARVLERMGTEIEFQHDQWHHLRMEIQDRDAVAKIWPDGGSEPDWQIRVPLEDLPPGRVGFIAYDEGVIDFRHFRVWTGKELKAQVSDLERQRAERRRQAVTQARLSVEATPYLVRRQDGPGRRLDVTIRSGGDVLPLAGRLSVEMGDYRHVYPVREFWFQGGTFPIVVPEPRAPAVARLRFEHPEGAALEAHVKIAPQHSRLEALTRPVRPIGDRYRRVVRECLDTLIEKGTDRYGPVHTPMLMAVIDVNTLTAPHEPPLLDSYYRTEGRPDHGRRSPGGSNLWLDTPTIQVLYRMSELTGDNRYATAADAYMRSVMENAVKPNGMFGWGSHIYYDAYTDRLAGDHDGQGPHEILIHHPPWRHLYRLNPDAVTREIQAIWDHHIRNKQTGQHNRHDGPGIGDFAFSGGSFAMAFAFMHQATGRPEWRERAHLLANYHWDPRDRKTGLACTAPHGMTNPRYFNSQHCTTQLIGPFASQMLACYELTGDTLYRDIAFGYIKAYQRYGWDPDARQFFGALKLDGTPLYDKADYYNYVWAPDGHVDVWRVIMYSWEFPLVAAQTAVHAWTLSGSKPEDRDPALLQSALCWAEVIEKALPPGPGRRWRKELFETLPRLKDTGGTYAENYGRAISFFVALHRATGEAWYRNRAEQLADEAIEKLFVNGIFRGHPAKDYYEACDGVGFLLHALLELDALPAQRRPAF